MAALAGADGVRVWHVVGAVGAEPGELAVRVLVDDEQPRLAAIDADAAGFFAAEVAGGDEQLDVGGRPLRPLARPVLAAFVARVGVVVLALAAAAGAGVRVVDREHVACAAGGELDGVAAHLLRGIRVGCGTLGGYPPRRYTRTLSVASRDPVCVRCKRCRWFARRFYGVGSFGWPVLLDGRSAGAIHRDTGEFWILVRCERCSAPYEFPKRRLVELLDVGRRDLTLGVDL